MNSVDAQAQTEERYSPTAVEDSEVKKSSTGDTLSMSPISSVETQTSSKMSEKERDLESAVPPQSNQVNGHKAFTEGPLKDPQMEQPASTNRGDPTLKTAGVSQHLNSRDQDNAVNPPPQGINNDFKPYEVIMHHDDRHLEKSRSHFSAADSIEEEVEEELKYPRIEGRDYVDIHNDVYNMFFLSHWGGHAFWYSFYIFTLKMTLYTLLAISVVNDGLPELKFVKKEVLAAQFLMLPVAVAMQEDITGTYFLIANIRYCESVKNSNENADKAKFYISITLRAIDGFYSLFVNFVVLISNQDVLSLFLNFAALQFLQTIDNIALEMASQGFLSDRLEEVAENVLEASLPKRNEDHFLRAMDSILFILTVLVLMIIWLCLYFQVM